MSEDIQRLEKENHRLTRIVVDQAETIRVLQEELREHDKGWGDALKDVRRLDQRIMEIREQVVERINAPEGGLQRKALRSLLDFIDNVPETPKEPEEEKQFSCSSCDGILGHMWDCPTLERDPEPNVSRDELHERLRELGAEVPVVPRTTLREKLQESHDGLVPYGDPWDASDVLRILREHFDACYSEDSELSELINDIYDHKVVLHGEIRSRLRQILLGES